MKESNQKMVDFKELCISEPTVSDPTVLPGYSARLAPVPAKNVHTKAVNISLSPAQHFALAIAAKRIAPSAAAPTQDELLRYANAVTYPTDYTAALTLLNADE